MQSEKQIEDYICKHQETFLQTLKEVFECEDATFIGRLAIGKDHRLDLLYKIADIDKNTPIGEVRYESFVVVELKNRELLPEDFNQLARYTSVLDEKLKNSNYFSTKGLLVAPEIGTKAQNILAAGWLESQVKVMIFSTSLSFSKAAYFWRDEYINELELDSRIVDALKEKKDGQPATTK